MSSKKSHLSSDRNYGLLYGNYWMEVQTMYMQRSGHMPMEVSFGFKIIFQVAFPPILCFVTI